MRYCRLRQICLVARDLPRVIDDMQAIFGVTLAYQDPHVRKYGLANALFPFGLAFVEIVSPIEPQTAAGRFLERSGGIGGYMAIFNCDDPMRWAAHANALGVRTAHEMRYETFCGVQLHPRDCRAAMIEFDRSDGEEDLRGAYYPAGGTAWTSAIRTDVTAGIREIVIETPDPFGLASHWAAILDMPMEADGDDFRIAPDMIGIRFTRGAGAREYLRTIVLDAVDSNGMAARAIGRGYRADASGIEIAGVRFRAT